MPPIPSNSRANSRSTGNPVGRPPGRPSKSSQAEAQAQAQRNLTSLPSPAKPEFNNRHILEAVQQLLKEKENERHELLQERNEDLSSLYLLVRTLVRGEGFAQMADQGKAANEVEETDDALAMFKDEYTLKEE